MNCWEHHPFHLFSPQISVVYKWLWLKKFEAFIIFETISKIFGLNRKRNVTSNEKVNVCFEASRFRSMFFELFEKILCMQAIVFPTQWLKRTTSGTRRPKTISVRVSGSIHISVAGYCILLHVQNKLYKDLFLPQQNLWVRKKYGVHRPRMSPWVRKAFKVVHK